MDGVYLSEIDGDEREYFLSCMLNKRNCNPIVYVFAVSYWIRTKHEICLISGNDHTLKRVYMTLCHHLAMKWDGYDEYDSCPGFARDLCMIDPSMNQDRHIALEIDLMKRLGYILQ